jgi:alcohol dehydrogenase
MLIAPKPAAHFAAGAIKELPGIVRGTGAEAAVIVTDAALAATPVIGHITYELAEARIPVHVFSGVHPNPTTDDIAAGAVAVAEVGAKSSTAIVAVGGGSPLDAAKGIALAAVNPQRGRDLDYRNAFRQPALPLIAVPTTAGTGAETNAFGVVTDPAAHRKFYVGHATAMPAAAIGDAELTVGLPRPVTAATGMDALTHALESYLSARPNPWSDGIALQVIRMVSENLPRAYDDGTDLEARAAMLLAAHMAGVAMANTGLGIAHAIGHSLGGRWNIAHGVTLTMVLPEVLRFNRAVREDRTADIAFALGAGDTAADRGRNADAAIDAVAALAERVGVTQKTGDFGISEADYAQIAADALDDEVLASTPRRPAAGDITKILAASA